ncbi:hypothetical protein [Gemmatimonas sp.]|uniref:hypothetical protein n=1 Tax=Gemmatimonas sp. TaxID=1962908 RepID=UPI003DA455B2
MDTTVGFAVPKISHVAATDVADDSFLDALTAATEATDPDTAAAAAEHVTAALMPLLQRVAAAYAATWPSFSMGTTELLHEAVAAVLAGLPLVPRRSKADAVAWCSAEVFRVLHAARQAADGATTKGSRRLASEAPQDPRLRHVLCVIAPRDAELLRLRSAGARWVDVARHLGVSAATARRLHARALAAARVAAAPLIHAA